MINIFVAVIIGCIGGLLLADIADWIEEKYIGSYMEEIMSEVEELDGIEW